jgi:hypothetical protein
MATLLSWCILDRMTTEFNITMAVIQIYFAFCAKFHLTVVPHIV